MVVQDQAMIFAYLHGMEALANLREPALRALCSSVRYEWHDANEIIYWSVYNYIFFFSLFFLSLILLGKFDPFVTQNCP